MGWEPLTRTYCAESVQGNVVFAHTFDATDLVAAERIAERIAERNGWTLLGELVDEVEAEEEMIAQLEKTLSSPTVH